MKPSPLSELLYHLTVVSTADVDNHLFTHYEKHGFFAGEREARLVALAAERLAAVATGVLEAQRWERQLKESTSRELHLVKSQESTSMLTVEQAAAAMGVCTKTCLKLIQTGRLPAKNYNEGTVHKPLWRVPSSAVLATR
ncbi:MerR family transcriptional regulator [Hymenobacter jejuensis]|uniref:Helix-turn-helix domain-containing protein n=1 Tax=Hymenobacter jejuensis TaxID=2502781 RepID=A0A5B8A2Z3_9BACT|nr:helix-turn-helix domain-containing protein [Hymenobacter jejuensis]QDA61670.1 helix-turn-helix domain-containing protein [Hymenobacter jejuensis]